MIKKIFVLRNTVLALVLVAAGSYLHAAETETITDKELPTVDGNQHRFELARQYYGQCQNADAEKFELIRPYLRAFTDMEVMADTMADPAKFMELMAAVNDPHTMHVMTKCASEPVMWDTWMKGMTDFNKMSRVMTRFMNPNMYFNWMVASMNPATYHPFMKMSDPAYFNKWMTALANPTFYQPMTQMADPNWYTPRIAWMTNPQSMQPFFNMMNLNMMNRGLPQPVTTAAPAAE